MKKGCAWLTLLCLLLGFASGALAAPVRRQQVMEITIDEKLQALVDTLASAAVLRGVNTLGNAEAPSQPLVEGMVSMGLMRGTLPGQDGQTALLAHRTQAQMARDCASFFTAGDYEEIETPLCPCITADEDGLAFDLADLSAGPFVNAYIYRAEFDGERAALLCDLYTVEPDQAGKNAAERETAGFSYLCGAEIYVKIAPGSAFGYTVSAFWLTPDYAAAETEKWRAVDNTESGYTVWLPPVLGLADDRADCLAFETADSAARLTIQTLENPGGYDEAVQSFLLEAGEEKVEEHREQGFCTAVGSGIYEMMTAMDGLPCAYLLTFIFPPEYQAEYTLYAELISNSFMVWEAANG